MWLSYNLVNLNKLKKYEKWINVTMKELKMTEKNNT